MISILEFTDSFNDHVIRVASIDYIGPIKLIPNGGYGDNKSSFCITINGGFTFVIEYKQSVRAKGSRDYIIDAMKDQD